MDGVILIILSTLGLIMCFDKSSILSSNIEDSLVVKFLRKNKFMMICFTFVFILGVLKVLDL